jgi:hypothetical protein
VITQDRRSTTLDDSSSFYGDFELTLGPPDRLALAAHGPLLATADCQGRRQLIG